jgi:hypothetical protein
MRPRSCRVGSALALAIGRGFLAHKMHRSSWILERSRRSGIGAQGFDPAQFVSRPRCCGRRRHEFNTFAILNVYGRRAAQSCNVYAHIATKAVS